MKDRLLSLSAVGIAAASLGIAVNQGNRIEGLEKQLQHQQIETEATIIFDCRTLNIVNYATKRPLISLEGCRQMRTEGYMNKGTMDISR